jgi:hypothetical protein
MFPKLDADFAVGAPSVAPATSPMKTLRAPAPNSAFQIVCPSVPALNALMLAGVSPVLVIAPAKVLPGKSPS